MANLKVTQFTTTVTPAQGTDVIPIVQTADLATGQAKQTTLDEVKTFMTQELYVLMMAGIFTPNA